MKNYNLKPGKDVATLTENVLRLMAQGVPRGQAKAYALNAAGYRPSPPSPAASPSRPLVPPTPVVPVEPPEATPRRGRTTIPPLLGG